MSEYNKIRHDLKAIVLESLKSFLLQKKKQELYRMQMQRKIIKLKISKLLFQFNFISI